MPLPKESNYTVNDIYTLPEGERAELIDGKLYMMTPPSRIHQKLVMELSATIRGYIKENGGLCEVYPAPFAVFLNEENYVENAVCTRYFGYNGISSKDDWNGSSEAYPRDEQP